jgi:hypothetical protein
MSIATQQVASLQAMGIDVYRLYQPHAERPAIVNKSWFQGLLNLLDITHEHCQFSDVQPISFDPINKILTLPLNLNLEDAALKREIWQKINGDVELQ